MRSFVVVFVALSHLYSVHAQGNPQQPNPTVVLIPPNAPVVVPTGTIKVGDPGVPPCQAYGRTWSPDPEAKCSVTTCSGRHNVECTDANFVDVFHDLNMFPKNKLFTGTNFRPLRLTVSNSSLTANGSYVYNRNFFASSTFSAVDAWIQELEITNTDLGDNLDRVFDGMVNLTKATLSGDFVDSIGVWAFDGLPALREVNINNLQGLRKIDSRFADPLLKSGACLTMYLNADNLTCDCYTVKYVQEYRKRMLAKSQLAAGNPPASSAVSTNGTCDVNIWCQLGSQKINMKDINTDELCKDVTVVLVATTTKKPQNTGNTIAYHGNYPALLISFVLLFAAIMR